MADKPLKSDTILSQIDAHSLTEKIIEIDEPNVSFFIFQLGDYLFSFCGSQAREILPYTALTWIPGATAHIPGVINLRGDVAAVLDLKQILGMNEANYETTGAAFIVMVRSGDGRNGFLVDTIIDVVEVPNSATKQVLSTLDERFKRFASSQFEYRRNLVTVLDASLLIEKVNS
ncbi:chemotaxis protein CheW [Sporomusa sp. KB1]|jgi:purine-binding chemotaxis protein CheW|uniref:chemotaxis protein CheW n=1 Tax=Sporomusa sp. KB1 TaxID=943346 RepID=UPI0011A77697|nr:chemotaxis protein CheW [Sporomusa sp. KB1]TWH45462.1 purine-binding chemotaxis protein CheW [Sporomusa sp. KB1]